MSSSGSETAFDAPVDVDALGLASGEAASLAGSLTIEPVPFGGQHYEFSPTPVEAALDVSAALSGVSFHLCVEGQLGGPCWRCATTTALPVEVDSWEYQEHGRAPTDDEDGLDSAYVDSGLLDVSRWARDAIVEGLPDAILCRADCAGICAGCGVDLNEAACTCPPSEPDSRWDGLREIAERLKEAE